MKKNHAIRKTRLIGFFAILLNSGAWANAEDSGDSRQKLALYFQGMGVYEKQCQMCHGANGKGDGKWADDWTKNRPRNFRSGVFKFRTTPMGFLPTDEDLKRTILSGISGTAMPTFKNHLRDEELEAVVAYLKSFSREWKKAEKHTDPVELPKRPEWMRSLKESKAHALSGQKVYQNHCAVCHGPNGKGDGAGGAALKDVWEFDIRPADLSGKHFKSGDRAEDLFRTISLGLDGTPMVGFRGSLNDEQIWDLISFIATLQVEAK